jgi:hypothetical protein
MTAPAIPLRGFLEIISDGRSSMVFWVSLCECCGGSRQTIHFGDDYFEARAAAYRWAAVLGLPVRDLRALH